MALQRVPMRLRMRRRTLVGERFWLPTLLLITAFGIRLIAASNYWAWYDAQFPDTWEISRLVPSQDGSQYVMQSEPDVWAARLYQGWRDKSYYRPPLASYYFATLLPIFNFNRMAISAIQALLACCGYLFLYLLFRRHFSGMNATLVLAVAAFHPILIFYDTSFEDTVLAFFLSAVGCYTLARPFFESTWYRFGIAGLLVGLASCARPNLIVVGFLFCFLLPWLVKSHRRAAVVSFTIPLIMCIAIPTFHNLRADGHFGLITSTAGENFYWGNSGRPEQRISLQGFWDIWEIDYLSPTWILLGELRRGNRASKQPPRFAAAAWRNIMNRPVKAFITLMQKTFRHLSTYEIPRNRNFELLRSSSSVFRLPLIPFALILGLALIGTRPDQLQLSVRLVMLAPWIAALITEIVFFNASRYRALSIPFLLPFSIQGAMALLEWAKARRFWPMASGLILLAVFLYIGVRVVDEKERERYLSASYFKAAIRESYADTDGRWELLSEERFSKHLARSLQLDPNNLDAFALLQKYRIRQGHASIALSAIEHRRRGCQFDDSLCTRVCDALHGLAKASVR